MDPSPTSFQAAALPSSMHMHFTQQRSKQTLCPLESGGWREAPSSPKKSEVPRVLASRQPFVTWSMAICGASAGAAETPESWNLQGGGVLCSQSGWGHKHQGHTRERRSRCTQGSGPSCACLLQSRWLCPVAH